jgi:hypothetical protein
MSDANYASMAETRIEAHPTTVRLGTTDFRELLGMRTASGRAMRQSHEEVLAETTSELNTQRERKASLAGLERQQVTMAAAIAKDKRDLYLHQQAIDTTTPAGRAMFQMMGVFAEFERAMIRERVNAGLARARAQGKRLGRPRVDAAAEARVREFLAAGYGVQKSARLAGVGGSTAQRAKAETSA